MLKEGDPAPDFTALDHTGTEIRLSELKGKKVNEAFPAFLEMTELEVNWASRAKRVNWVKRVNKAFKVNEVFRVKKEFKVLQDSKVIRANKEVKDSKANKEVKVLFMDYIRKEEKFKNIESLIEQLEKDKQLCLSIEN